MWVRQNWRISQRALLKICKLERKAETMKRRVLLLALFLLALVCSAQHQQKWKAPKRPMRPKWEAPKQKAPEVINVWRPYRASDNWFVEFSGGGSVSMAENMSGHGLGKICMPMFDFGVGKQFSNVWSTRLVLGYRQQKGWASKEALAVSSLLEDGDYQFKVAVASIDEMLSLTNMLCPYNELRRLNVQLFAGLGLNYSFDFDKKVEKWTRYGYPVDGTDFVNFALRGGLAVQYKMSEALDLTLQGAYTAVSDNYNGVKHSESFAFDTYLDVSVGIKFHLMDHYGNSRYYKVRRWEATALRASTPRVARLLDNEKVKEYQERESAEVVAFGDFMKTRISFYVDRTYVNDYQMENLRIVADFLRKHPEVHLVVKGYCGASAGSESPDMHLAERRVEAVKKALVKYYDVDPARFDTWFDEHAAAPFPMKGEWIDGVVFLMEEK